MPTSLLTALASWIQPSTLSLMGVILLWQQVRFLSQRVEELKQETNTRLDRIDQKLDQIMMMQVSVPQASKAPAAERLPAAPPPQN